MFYQDRFAIEKLLYTKRAHQNVQVAAICPTTAVAPTGNKIGFNPASVDLSCNVFPTCRFAKPVEVAVAEFYDAFPVSAVVNGALLIAEGGLARV